MFKGWDYTELAKAWNQPYDESDIDDEDELAERLRYYLQNILSWDHNNRVMKKHADDIRAYCFAMSQFKYVGCPAIWKGFSEEENDWELIRTFSYIVELAWT